MNKKNSIVMVIEDETILLDAIARKLQSNGLSVISCVSGKQALEMLANSQKLPDVIWLDYYLGDMNGLEFMYAIKENKRIAQIPTIVVSNSASENKVKNMLTLGVKKYYLKAENRLDDIIAAVKELVENKENIRDEKS